MGRASERVSQCCFVWKKRSVAPAGGGRGGEGGGGHLAHAATFLQGAFISFPAASVAKKTQDEKQQRVKRVEGGSQRTHFSEAARRKTARKPFKS